MSAPVTIKIASASCNQTGGDWPRNLANIKAAIDAAAQDGADILSLEELGLTGYERGDDFYYSDNAKTHLMLQMIADHAVSKSESLIVSVGHPWYFADKNVDDAGERRKNPIFNRVNNQFNVQTFISGGKIIAMSAKRYLFNYERGYEKRHFEEWSEEKANTYENTHGKGRDGTVYIHLPDIVFPGGRAVKGRIIPFGAPVIAAGDDQRRITLTHVICEEYWVGSRYDSTAEDADYDRDNPLAQKARHFDITVALNPNASPPVAGKIDKHIDLCKMASRYCGVFVHTDGLGSSGSTFAQFGSRLMAQNEKIISAGRRASFADMAYTSQIVTVKAARDKGHEPHAVIAHDFRDHHAPAQQDGLAPWEQGPRREMEEELRNEILWLFDYMRKNKIQGVTQALSGGADSAYNAAKVRLMAELAIAELGMDGFFKAMPHLSYKDQVLSVYREKGVADAIDELMSHMLTCVYMGTDNSSPETLRAARTLVEGGVTQEGESYKGIGGKFYYRNVQRLVEIYAQIFSGVNPSALPPERDHEVRVLLADILRTRAEDTTPADFDIRIGKVKSDFEEIAGVVLSVAKPEHRLAYENIQARLRQVLIMLFANVENKIAIANPNLDEGRNSYATWGGDLHGGMISGNAHKPKQRELDHMKLLFDHGLDGIAPVRAFYHVLQNRPSAELQPLSKDGKVTQFDEDQLGRSFTQMDVISHYMLEDRSGNEGGRKNNPIEVFEKCRVHPAFAGDTIEQLHDRIRLSYEKWAHAQFKIHGSPVAATYGRSVDHQSSLRTPNISSFHRPELAQMAIYCLAAMAARDGIAFVDIGGGAGADELMLRALVDETLAGVLSAGLWHQGKSGLGYLYDRLKRREMSLS